MQTSEHIGIMHNGYGTHSLLFKNDGMEIPLSNHISETSGMTVEIKKISPSSSTTK